MSENKYCPPKYSTAEFHCPYCGVYAEQRWSYISALGSNQGYYSLSDISYFRLVLSDSYAISQCQYCKREYLV